MNFSRDLGERYSPLYFFNAFAAGMIAVSFFMYLLWTAKNLYSAVPSTGMLFSLITENGVLSSIACIIGLAGFLVFGALHVLLLRWNFRSLRRWQLTPPYKTFEKSPDKTILLTIPMTLTLSVILGLMALLILFPYALDIDEILLGLALLLVAMIGWKALNIYASFLSHMATQALAEDSKGNNLGQMISILSFSMLALTFAALSSLSTIKATLVLAFFFSTLFTTLAFAVAFVWFMPQLRILTESKISPESSPLLCFSLTVICALTLASLYLDLSLLSSFGANTDAGHAFSLMSFAISISLFAGFLGKELIQSHGFWDRLLRGDLYASGLYAVLCPSISLCILGHYVINVGLVQTSLLEAWNVYYWLFHLPLIALQAFSIQLFFRLNAKLFPAGKAPHTLPTSRK